jgi:hypothetical protein
MGKNEALVWAMHIVQDCVKTDAYGVVTISMANGHISGAKCEIHHKPPVDGMAKSS